MKKLFIMMAAAMLTATVSAQKTTIVAREAGDNWYVGINAGAATPMKKWGEAGLLKGFAPKVGVRVGKNFTTVFGMAVDGAAYFESSEKSMMKASTFIDAIDVNVLATFNLMNAFAGYKGEPRTFEISALFGPGWGHAFATPVKVNSIIGKAALDFALNLGAAKAWQVYLEPAVVFGLWGKDHGLGVIGTHLAGTHNDCELTRNAGIFQLSAGVNYKFGTSNGTHNFAVEQLRDQAEIDALNAQINDARRVCDEKCATRDAEIARLKKAIEDCENKPAPVVEKPASTTLQPIVLFRQGKSTIDAVQYAPIELIAHYMKNNPDAKIEIKGYASPEGKAAYNQKLSEKRAEVVKNALVKKYGIAADRLTTVGCGATDKLFEQVEFNRVTTFSDK